MSEEARDSGICVDNDDDSSFHSTSSFHDFNQLSYVQRLRKRFECLAKEQEKEFHSECNWWLEEEEGVERIDTVETCPRHEEEKVNEAKNKVYFRNASAESETKIYSKQSSIKSQISQENVAKVTVTPATPVKTPTTPPEYPIVTFTDYEENNETNDSDSFDSDNGEEEVEKSIEIEVEEELPPEYIRNSRQSLKLMRPISITSQTSK